MSEAKLAARMMLFGCDLGIQRISVQGTEIQNMNQNQKQILATELQGIIEQFNSIWLSRNRSGGLKDSIQRLYNTLNLLQK